MMWRRNEAGDWYWPLHPNRTEDHLRVWRVREGTPVLDNKVMTSHIAHDEWRGALVLDGEYLDVCRTHPHGNPEDAKTELLAIASLYLNILAEAVRRA
jgi:hypothetical protein